MRNSDHLGKYWKTYYERVNSAQQKLHPIQYERIEETLSMIPSGIQSILDIGCGDGSITNQIIAPLVIGMDASPDALKNVKSKKAVANINNLPFKNKSFDLVMCAEVIEHLNIDSYQQALCEIARVASKYILITVPFKEWLELSFARCISCGCIFHSSYHVRSFGFGELKNLLTQFGFECKDLRYICPILSADRTTKFEIFIRHRLAREYLTHSEFAVCPLCGYIVVQRPKRNLIGWICAIIRLMQKIFLRKAKPYWIGVLYYRKT